jgi:glycosyltransferase involved in cell wall biosynthesis
MGKRIVLVSSAQPTANPRMVKEALTLFATGYTVSVIYCPASLWADTFDAELFTMYPEINWVCVGYHPVKQKRLYQWARLRRKFYHLMFYVAGNKFDAAVRSFAFYSQELTLAAIAHKADLYIGHNIGALPSVVKAAQKNGSKVAFDFEDFHRGEDVPSSVHWKKTKTIEDCYVKLLTYATAASPLISKTYKELYPELNIQTINNCFPVSYRSNACTELPTHPLRLFWFSQFVGPRRGLETIIKAIGLLGNPSVQLTLLGNCNKDRKDFFINLAGQYNLLPQQLQFIEPVHEREIVRIASFHHIGLACEPGRDINNEIALSNKLFMYLLAGNAVLFSNTRAHADFRQKHPQVGQVYEQGNVEQIAGILKSYYEQQELLNAQRSSAFELGEKIFNWEEESKILLEQVKHVLYLS